MLWSTCWGAKRTLTSATAGAARRWRTPSARGIACWPTTCLARAAASTPSAGRCAPAGCARARHRRGAQIQIQIQIQVHVARARAPSPRRAMQPAPGADPELHPLNPKQQHHPRTRIGARIGAHIEFASVLASVLAPQSDRFGRRPSSGRGGPAQASETSEGRPRGSSCSGRAAAGAHSMCLVRRRGGYVPGYVSGHVSGSVQSGTGADATPSCASERTTSVRGAANTGNRTRQLWRGPRRCGSLRRRATETWSWCRCCWPTAAT